MFRGQCGRKCSHAGRGRKEYSTPAPAAVAILKTAGFKPREFMVITGALFSDFIAVGMKRQGTLRNIPRPSHLKMRPLSTRISTSCRP